MHTKLHEIVINGKVYRTSAIAFDKDGTLLQSQPYWYEMWRVRKELIADLAGDEIASLWETEVGAPNGQFNRKGPFTVAPTIEGIILLGGLLYRGLGISYNQCRQHALRIYEEANSRINYANAVKVRPGALELVKSLKAAGIPAGIVTSDLKDRAHRTLQMAGFDESLWQFFFTPTDVKRPKPAPDMVLAAVEAVKCEPKNMMVIGDSEMDALMARQAGALAVSVPEEEEDVAELSPITDVLVMDLREIMIP